MCNETCLSLLVGCVSSLILACLDILSKFATRLLQVLAC